MSSEELRQAAGLMREESYQVRRPFGRDERFKVAVAVLLEAKAEQDDKGTCDDPRGCCNLCEHDYGHIAALEVARAYLGADQ